MNTIKRFQIEILAGTCSIWLLNLPSFTSSTEDWARSWRHHVFRIFYKNLMDNVLELKFWWHKMYFKFAIWPEFAKMKRSQKFHGFQQSRKGMFNENI
jgi:hypothetical protein